MLLILMYHQIIDPKLDHKLSLNKFIKHIEYLQKHFNFVVPGQNLLKHNICLTFDDAYVDFYNYIFPILKKLNIPAVLGIPAGLIQDTTDVDLKERLNIKYPLGLNSEVADITPLCTWKEIREMVTTGLIIPASHSLSHKNLSTIVPTDAYQELCVSKRIISVKLENITEILIYPFGSYNNNIQAMANSHYRYVMRIGNASNDNWDQKILYRIDADRFWKENKEFSKLDFVKWKTKFFVNKLRGK